MPSATPTIETARFTLREVLRSDAADLFPSFSDQAAMKWWSRDVFGSQAELAEWLVPESGWDEGRSWAVVAGHGDQVSGKVSGKVIGQVSGPVLARLAAMDRGDGVTEIAYLTIVGRQRQGIVTEALTGLIDHLFNAEGRRRLFADIDPDNDASNAVARRLGFVLEGRLRENMVTHIGPRDSLIWGLLPSDWHARKG